VPLVVVGAGWLIRNELAKRAALAPVRVAAEPAIAEPVNAEPVTSEPAVAEPVVAEPVPGELEVPV
jgi:ribonuclease E